VDADALAAAHAELWKLIERERFKAEDSES
jgi:hypothetical protein